MTLNNFLKSILSVFILALSASGYAQDVPGSSSYGIGARTGFSQDLGSLFGGELSYKSGSFQYELYSASSTINLKHSFSTEIEEPEVFTGSVAQGDIETMNAATSQLGLNVRWFFSGSTNLGFGFTQYKVDVDYELLSSDTTEAYSNKASAKTNAITISFGNQWRLLGFAYFGFDWIASFLPSKVENDSVTLSSENAPTDTGNLNVHNKIIEKASSISGSPANYITINMGLEF